MVSRKETENFQVSIRTVNVKISRKEGIQKKKNRVQKMEKDVGNREKNEEVRTFWQKGSHGEDWETVVRKGDMHS